MEKKRGKKARQGFKFQFGGEITFGLVGAGIARPRGTGYEFAESLGEFVTLACRTANGRPYIDFRNLSDKLQFTLLYTFKYEFK